MMIQTNIRVWPTKYYVRKLAIILNVSVKFDVIMLVITGKTEDLVLKKS